MTKKTFPWMPFVTVFILFGLSVIFPQSASAQTPIFIPLRISQDSTLTLLKSKPIYKHRKYNEKMIRASNKINYFTYLYDQDKLYKIIFFKKYAKRKDAEDSFEGVINYLKQTKNAILEKKEEDKKITQICIKDGVITEVTVDEIKGDVLLHIKMRDTSIDPSDPKDESHALEAPYYNF